MNDGVLVGTTSLIRSNSFDVNMLDMFVRAAVEEFNTDIDALAIAVPGVLDSGKCALISAHGKYSALLSFDLRNWASDRFGVPVGLENDARAALLGELRFGDAAGETDAVLMVLGTGIGTAAVMEGVLVSGRHGHAGILGGHVTVDINAAECVCGNVGCAESLASTWALGDALRNDPGYSESTWATFPQPEDIEALVSQATRGDEVSQRTLAHFVNVWGATLVSLCHAYDPEVVIVTGGVLHSAAAIKPQLQRYLHAHLWPSAHRPNFLVPAHPHLSVMRGLSALELSQQDSER